MGDQEREAGEDVAKPDLHGHNTAVLGFARHARWRRGEVPLGYTQLRQRTADAGWTHRPLCFTGKIPRRTRGGARMSRELDISERIVGLVGDSGEAEVTVFAGPTGLTRFANSYIHQNVAEEQLAVSLKVAARGRVASATTTNAGSEALHRL